MAIENASVIMSSALSAPEGHSQTDTATPLDEEEIDENLEFEISRGDIAGATAAAGFDNVFDEVESLVEDWIENTINIDIVNKHVDYIATVNGIRLNSVYEIYNTDATSTLIVKVNAKVYTYDIPA